MIAPAPMVMPPPAQPKKKSALPFILGGVAVVVVLVLLFAVVIPKINAVAQQKITDALMNAATGQTPSVTEVGTPSSILGGLLNNPTEVPQTQNTQASMTMIEKMPSDIPVFTPNNGDVTTSTTGTTLMFYYSTSTNQKEVRDFFLTQMQQNGWELVNTTEMPSQDAYMYYFTKDVRTSVINIVVNDPTTTFIQIVVDSTG
jgi:lipopolysaccharide export LptBFGC system permease protein LptF